MASVATLGPKGTFSDLATRSFMNDNEWDLCYTQTIKQVFEKMAAGMEYGVVPVENMSEGYVQPTLDAFLNANVSIIGELRLSVQFSFVAGVSSLDELETLYVQPVAFGQCSEFINALEGVTVIRTNSNIESLELQEGTSRSGAIVPNHVFESYDAPLKVANVSDHFHNETRFLLLRRGSGNSGDHKSCHAKSSLIIRDDQDHSGILNFITGAFTREEINITAIISRPTKAMMGKYHFFIDIDGSLSDANVQRAISEIRELYPVTLLGSYCRAV